MSRHPQDAAIGLFSEANFSIIGSCISILVGTTFLAAAILLAGTLSRENSLFGPEEKDDWRRYAQQKEPLEQNQDTLVVAPKGDLE